MYPVTQRIPLLWGRPSFFVVCPATQQPFPKYERIVALQTAEGRHHASTIALIL
jgi:hypothetical protein